MLPKIRKRLDNVLGRPVRSNCGAITEKASEFLDFHLKRVMQNGVSYVKDSNDFMNKVKNIDIPNDTLLVTADVVRLYPSIPHKVGLKALRNALENRNYKEIPTENLIKMAGFILKNNYFEFNSSVFQQISGTAIGTKFSPPYACVFMDQHETKFLETQILKPLVCFHYIDDIFFIWTHDEEKLRTFMENFNSFSDNIKFTCEFDKGSISFLDLKVISSNGKLMTSPYSKPTDCHQYLHYKSSHPEHTKQSIIYSQTFRIKRICSQESYFKEYSSKL